MEEEERFTLFFHDEKLQEQQNKLNENILLKETPLGHRIQEAIQEVQPDKAKTKGVQFKETEGPKLLDHSPQGNQLP